MKSVWPKHLYKNISKHINATINLSLIIISLVCLLLSGISFYHQKKLYGLLEVQSTKIIELANLRKDLRYFDQQKIDENKTVTNQVADLVKQLTEYKNTIQSNGYIDKLVLSASDVNKNIQGIVKINDPGSALTAYSSASIDSEATPIDNQEPFLFFYQKENDWYQVEINNGRLLWIQSQYLTELPN